MASPSIVTYGTGLSSFGTTITTSVGGTAQHDILLLWAGCDNGRTITGVVGTGLAWTKILDLTNAGSGNNNAACSLWWAAVPVATPTVSLVATFSGTVDDAAAILLCIRGCAIGSPFDPNGSLPLGWVGNPPGTQTFSTTENDDLLISFRGAEFGNPFNGVPAGWTLAAFAANSGGFGFMTVVAGYQSVATPQTNVSYNDDANIGSFGCIGITALTADTVLNPPGVPVSEACGANSDTSITAMWSAGSGGTPITYNLQWRLVGTLLWTQINGIVTTSQVITGLSAGSQYEWQAMAVNADGGSAFSGPFPCSTAPTPAPIPPHPQSLRQYRGQVGINFGSLVLIGDAFSGVVGSANFNTFTEYGNAMLGLIASPPVHEDRARVFVNRFEIDIESGVGLPVGQGSDPVWMLDYSKDGGRTFGPLQTYRSMGRIGAYLTRLRWLKLGQARQWIFRLQATDPVRRVIIGTYLDVKRGMK